VTVVRLAPSNVKPEVRLTNQAAFGMEDCCRRLTRLGKSYFNFNSTAMIILCPRVGLVQ